MNTMTARDLRDAGTSKPQSISASSTQKKRIITSYRTVSSTRNPSLTIFPYIWTIQAIQWRELWTTKVCMPHSLLLSHDKFMLHKLRPPRFAMSCNSTKKTRKKDPLVNSPITNPPLSFGMEVVSTVVLYKFIRPRHLLSIVPEISWYVPKIDDFTLFAHTNWLVHWYTGTVPVPYQVQHP